MREAAVLVTGASGLAGSAIKRMVDKNLNIYNPDDFFFATRLDGNLTREEDVVRLIKEVKPKAIIHTAAAVGGIGGNAANHGRFFHENILMNTHIIHHAYLNGVQKLIAFSSVCVYPDGLPLLQEDKIQSGPVYPSNEFYGYAKRMIDVQIRAYQKQYGIKNYMYISPGNIFGPNDNFDIMNGHVVPVLMHKLYLAKKNKTSFNIWGDGKSLREFLYIDDLARVCLELLDCLDMPLALLVTGKEEHSIKQVVDMLVEIADFKGKVVYETDKPNGQRSRPSDKTLFNRYFPSFEYTPLKTGLEKMWHWLVENYEIART